MTYLTIEVREKAVVGVRVCASMSMYVHIHRERYLKHIYKRANSAEI